MTLHLVDNYRGFLLAILPPGAFIGLGCLIAIKNVLDARAKKRRLESRPAVALREAGA
jgi:electron transport complex protein RnfE